LRGELFPKKEYQECLLKHVAIAIKKIGKSHPLIPLSRGELFPEKEFQECLLKYIAIKKT